MDKEILRSIDHVAIWPVISFIIFFLFFIMLLTWVFSVDKTFIRRMKEMPLEEDHAQSTDNREDL